MTQQTEKRTHELCACRHTNTGNETTHKSEGNCSAFVMKWEPSGYENIHLNSSIKFVCESRLEKHDVNKSRLLNIGTLKFSDLNRITEIQYRFVNDLNPGLKDKT